MTTTFSSVIRGVAFGDAWGDPVEFNRIEAIILNDPKGPELPERLRITDDTQMSLFLADALDLTRNGDMAQVKDAILNAYLDYAEDPDSGSRAPGVTVMGSLRNMAWDKETATWNWKRATNGYSDGSGTVMRTSSAAFLPEDRWVGITAFAAAATHGAANAIAAAILDVAILRELIAGKIVPGELVDRALQLASHPTTNGLLNTGEWLEDYPVDLRTGFAELTRLLERAVILLPGLTEDPWKDKWSDPSMHIGGGGWRGHETLVIALLAVDMLAGEPIESLRRAVTSDGDSDTIGAVAGAVIGAAYPEEIGEAWAQYALRFEDRYRRWIEFEADDYLFVPDEVEDEKSVPELLAQSAAALEQAEDSVAKLGEVTQRQSNRSLIKKVLGLK